MVLDYKYFRPIKVVGILFLFAGIFGGLFYLAIHNDPELELSFHVFILVNSFWYLATGSGILLQKMWGYYLLKLYVFILILGFPIGTYYGLKSLKYLREKNIKEFFINQAIDI